MRSTAGTVAWIGGPDACCSLYKGLNGVAALGDAAVNDVAFVAQTFFRAAEGGVELDEIPAADITQLTTLQGVPDPFDRIELGCVPGQLLQMHPPGGPTRQEILDRLAAVNRGPIPDDEQLSTDLAQEDAVETDHTAAVIGAGLGLHAQPPASR